MDSSASLETLFDIKSQHMGIVSVSSNPSNNWIATNTVDGYICIRDSETGIPALSTSRDRISGDVHDSGTHGGVAHSAVYERSDSHLLRR